jgi:Tat protein translocase TatB subunit
VPVTLLILESFGTQEFLLILVVALIFFGPRKLPQLSRQIGKSLAEFRKASEDFKRTWEREVALESSATEQERNPTTQPANNSISEPTVWRGQTESVIPDESYVGQLESAEAAPHTEITEAAQTGNAGPSNSTSKRDWL